MWKRKKWGANKWSPKSLEDCQQQVMAEFGKELQARDITITTSNWSNIRRAFGRGLRVKQLLEVVQVPLSTLLNEDPASRGITLYKYYDLGNVDANFVCQQIELGIASKKGSFSVVVDDERPHGDDDDDDDDGDATQRPFL